MSAPRRHPQLLEVHARLWLRRLSTLEGRRLTLSAIPDERLDWIAGRFDLLWLMGAWRRSTAARAEALAHPGLRRAYDAALPGWSTADVQGSPYAVQRYQLDPALGAPHELERFRDRLAGRGVGLIVDFVPNHLARDHPWTASHPERFVRADDELARERPELFFRAADGPWLAHGRDPHFPPWTDTAQLDASSPDTREALARELLAIAARADGARCDMAMLALSDVFEETWGFARRDGRAAGELWEEVIGRVKAAHPRFVLLAEAYWGLEERLLDLGFDYVYDKPLYDALASADAGAIRRRLGEAYALQSRRLRFVENHDEPRAPALFGPAGARAAAAAVLTLPGARLVYEGQPEGRRVHLPVQLGRAPDEPPDPETAEFYERLFDVARRPAFHEGAWSLLELEPPEPAGPEDDSHRRLVAWSWRHRETEYLVVYNPTGEPAEARIRPKAGAPPAGWLDLLGGEPAANPVRVEPRSTKILAPAREPES